MDSVEGGTLNNYVYPPDPVNDFDLSGEKSQRGKQSGQPKRLNKLEQDLINLYRSGGGINKKDQARLRQGLQKLKTNEKLQNQRQSRQIKDVKGSKAPRAPGTRFPNESIWLIEFFLPPFIWNMYGGGEFAAIKRRV